MGSDEDSLKRYRRLFQQSNAQLETLKRENDKLKGELQKREQAPSAQGKQEPDKPVKCGPRPDPPESERPDKNMNQQNLVTDGPAWMPASERVKGDYQDDYPAEPRIPRRLV